MPPRAKKAARPIAARGLFRVGQIVELDASGFGPGALLQTGERGTVVAPGRVNGVGAVEYKVLWHKDGVESGMVQDRLRMYTHPMDKPGRATGAFSTMEALRTVLQEEQPHAMAEVLRELEGARMAAEDWRGQWRSSVEGTSKYYVMAAAFSAAACDRQDSDNFWMRSDDLSDSDDLSGSDELSDSDDSSDSADLARQPGASAVRQESGSHEMARAARFARGLRAPEGELPAVDRDLLGGSCR